MNRTFAYVLVFAMVAGIAAGWLINLYFPEARAAEIADGLSILTDLFLRLIKMIIAPLVFATLVAGIAHMEDAAAIGRVGVKTMGWFIGASIVSLTIGLSSNPAPGCRLTCLRVMRPRSWRQTNSRCGNS